MYLTKMLKKLVTAVCLLAVVGMFAACSSPSSSSSDSDPVKEDYVYEFIYKGQTVATGMTGKQVLAIIEEYGLKEGKDYKVDNDKKTVTFTDSGYEKATKADQGGSNGKSGFPTPTGDYYVKCDGAILAQCEKEDFEEFGKKFTKDTDGTLSSDGKTFTLNDTGLDKFIKLIAEDPHNPVTNPVAVLIYSNYPMFAVDKDTLDTIKSVLTENTDYKSYKNGKIIVLTDSGFVKGSSKN